MIRGCALTMLGACFSQPAAPVAPLAPVAKPPSRALAPCPTGDGLASVAAKLMKRTDLQHTTCAAGRFPRAGWVITAEYYDERVEVRRIIVTGDRIVASVTTQPDMSTSEFRVTDHVSAFDFDLDGTDELLSVTTIRTRSDVMQELVVDRLVDGKWREVLRRSFDYQGRWATDMGDASTCGASWTIDAASDMRAIVFDPKTTIHPLEVCVVRRERWSIDSTGVFARER